MGLLVRLVDKRVDALSALQHAFDGLVHDNLSLVELLLDAHDRICLFGVLVLGQVSCEGLKCDSTSGPGLVGGTGVGSRRGPDVAGHLGGVFVENLVQQAEGDSGRVSGKQDMFVLARCKRGDSNGSDRGLLLVSNDDTCDGVWGDSGVDMRHAVPLLPLRIKRMRGQDSIGTHWFCS